MAQLVVRGEIEFDRPGESVGGADVRAWVEDVSRQDAPALIVSPCYEQKLSPRATTSENIAFEIDSDISETQSTYNIRVHIDVDQDGQISVGDYITMESISFAQENSMANIIITVRKVE